MRWTHRIPRQCTSTKEKQFLVPGNCSFKNSERDRDILQMYSSHYLTGESDMTVESASTFCVGIFP